LALPGFFSALLPELSCSQYFDQTKPLLHPPVWAEFAIASSKLIVKTRRRQFERKFSGGHAKRPHRSIFALLAGARSSHPSLNAVIR
jgi:hypothetical protein